MDILDDIVEWSCNIFDPCLGRTAADDLRDIALGLSSNNNNNNNYPNNNNYERLEDQVDLPDRMRMIPKFNIRPVDRTDVKIRLNGYYEIVEIMIKRLTEKDYVRVPFEPTNNPSYIQGIIDEWFYIQGDYIVASDALFENMELYYYNKNGKSSEWFKKHTEWIKFSNHTHINASDDQIKRPCGFKSFEHNDFSE